ncbi:MAG: hypothetical protein ABI229_10740 [Gemmatimonadaceae bacterium]
MRSRAYPFLLGSILTVLTVAACHGADQDSADRRRSLAQQTCESGVRDQLASRATAQFPSDSEHVYYDSTGGAGVTGVVSTGTGQRNFACILKPASDSTWILSAAQLLN